MRHLEGPKNLDGLKLDIHIFVMCTKYTRVCICEEAGKDLGLTAFFFKIFFLPKKKAKDVNANHR